MTGCIASSDLWNLDGVDVSLAEDFRLKPEATSGRLARAGAGPEGASLTTVFASLSSRSPRYTGCRSLLSSVHSVKRTCATRSGLTQCAVSLLLIGVANGERAI